MENAPRARQLVLLVGRLDEGLSEDKTLIKLDREADILRAAATMNQIDVARSAVEEGNAGVAGATVCLSRSRRGNDCDGQSRGKVDGDKNGTRSTLSRNAKKTSTDRVMNLLISDSEADLTLVCRKKAKMPDVLHLIGSRSHGTTVEMCTESLLLVDNGITRA